jgi:hypothetical protein
MYKKKRMKFIKYITLISLVFLLGCIAQDRSAWTDKDTWYNAPTDNGLEPWNWDEKQFYEVKPASQKEVQYLLNEKQIIQIPLKQANKFSKQQIQKVENYDYFLVRGVFLNEYTGSFIIYSKGKQLWIYHGSLGHSPVSMKRKALIVALDQMPDEIFVTCMMDE